MAKIRNSNPKQSGGGYERLVGDKDMASIFTKAQSTVISNGTELEKIISNRSNTITDLDAFIDDCDNGTVADGSYLCTKHEEFEAFCKAHGMSKVGATEQAIRQYMDKMNKALKNVK